MKLVTKDNLNYLWSKIKPMIDSKAENMIVTFTDNEDGTISADKTYNEVLSALNSGNNVVGYYQNYLLQANCATELAPTQARVQVTNQIGFHAIPGNFGMIFSISLTINMDDRVDLYVYPITENDIPSDWNETDENSPSFILNKPTKLTDFENDLFYYREEESISLTSSDFTESVPGISTYAVGNSGTYVSQQSSLNWISSVDDFKVSLTLLNPETSETLAFGVDSFEIEQESIAISDEITTVVYHIYLNTDAFPVTYAESVSNSAYVGNIIIGYMPVCDAVSGEEVLTECDGASIIIIDPFFIEYLSSFKIYKCNVKEIPLNCIEKFITVGKITKDNGEIFNGGTDAYWYAHAEGEDTIAMGRASHAEGSYTDATGYSSHSEGSNTNAIGHSAHAEGCYTSAIGYHSHAEGGRRKKDNSGNHSGIRWEASALPWLSKDIDIYGPTAEGNQSHAEGTLTYANGYTSHAEGWLSISSGDASHAEGYETTTVGMGSHAEGGNFGTDGNRAVGLWTNTTDYPDTLAYNICVNGPVAYGINSHAEGFQTLAAGYSSHSEGSNTKAIGHSAHAEGIGTHAGSNYQHTEGKYNVEDKDNTYAHIVGNGTSYTNRSNAYTLDWDGNAEFAGDVTINGCGGENPIKLSEIATKATANPDWNENDETSSAYVANRTHYTTAPIETTLVSCTNALFGNPWGGDSLISMTNATAPITEHRLVDGDNYTVTINGTVYENVVCQVDPNYPDTFYVGDTADSIYTSYPFYIEYNALDNRYSVRIQQTEENAGGGYYDITITGKFTEVVQLDEKYISYKPGRVVRGESFTIDNTDHVAQVGAEIFNSGNGNTNIAVGEYSHAEGQGTTAFGNYSHSEGFYTKASGNMSHTEGYYTKASGDYSHAECSFTEASGANSHSEGSSTTASGDYSHSEGRCVVASGKTSHAEGGYSEHLVSSKGYLTINLTADIGATTYTVNSDIDASYEHIIRNLHGLNDNARVTNVVITDGKITTITFDKTINSGRALDNTDISFELYNVAAGEGSHVEGLKTIAVSEYQHVQGKYNIPDADNVYAHIVGNGSNSTNISNAHTVDWNGVGWYASDIRYGGTNQDDAVSLKSKIEELENLIKAVLPEPTADTEGAFLRIVDGKWTSVVLQNAEDVAF